MELYKLINHVGNGDLVRMYLINKISLSDLIQEIGVSSAELVEEYKNNKKG